MLKTIKYFLCISACLLMTELYGQSLKVRLHNIPGPGKFRSPEIDLILGAYYSDKFNFVEAKNISLDTFQEFEFTIPANSPVRLYQLFIADKADKMTNKAEFIWSAKEDLVMDALFYQLKDGSISIEKSYENEAYNQLNLIKSKFDPVLEELYRNRMNLSVFDPKYKSKVFELEIQTEKIQYDYNINLVQIAGYYPKTFTADFLVPINRIPARSAQDTFMKSFDSYISFLNKNYFKHVDFSNAALLNHYALNDKIFHYLNFYCDKSTEGLIEAIDYIMSNLKNNQEVNDYVFNTLVKTFVKLNNETITKHLMDKHSNSCALSLPFDEMKKLQSMNALSIGAAVPEISLPDKEGNYHSLRSYCKQHKLTVLVFWISWCGRCKKEIPLIDEIYNKFKSKGMGVYAVSLDEKKEDWIKAIKAVNGNKKDVCELVPLSKSQALQSYLITTTPAVFVLNEKGELLQKNLFGERLESFLKDILK